MRNEAKGELGAVNLISWGPDQASGCDELGVRTACPDPSFELVVNNQNL